MAIKFGTWSTTLLLGSLHGLVVAGLLLRARRNRSANRVLAALLVAVVLLITPYTIGYAGFYDRYPWLSFAPFDWRLAFGPLTYLYVRQLGALALPRRWGRHFIPAAIQGGYYLVMFAMPLATKDAWDREVHVPWIVPIETWATYLSLAAYGAAAYRRYRAGQRWLEHNSAAREELRLGWLRAFLIAMAAVVAVQLGFDLVAALGHRLDYFDRFPLYLALTALVYYLGIEGWRHADRTFPQLGEAPPPGEPSIERAVAPPSSAPLAAAPPASPAPPAPPPEVSPDRDWTAVGQGWADRVRAEGWWREPELSLADLARRLGTNTRYLSRALNEGLGVSFSELINRQRVEAAQQRLTGDGEILAIALDVGFASKASFNRAFKAFAGCTPSAYRAAHRAR